MQPKKFEVLNDRVLQGEVCAKKGDLVYDFLSHDYGLSSDDTRHFGVEHVSVTVHSDGKGTPSFTIPKRDLKEIT